VYLGARKRKKHKGADNCIMRRLTICTLVRYDYDDQIRKDGRGGTCSMLATHQKQMYSEYSSRKNEGKRPLGNKDTDGKAKLSLA
jgi:hypothetical protein